MLCELLKSSHAVAELETKELNAAYHHSIINHTFIKYDMFTEMSYSFCRPIPQQQQQSIENLST